MKRALLVREKVTKLVHLLAQKRVKVTQRGSRAYVEYAPSGEPRLVNIPYIPEDASDEFLAAIEGFLDHEVAHILFTDFNVLVKAKKLGVAQLHNCVEDAFIEKMMAQTFKGSGYNLTQVARFFLKNFTDKELAKDPSQAVGLLMVPAIRALAGHVAYQEYMEGKWHLLDEVMTKAGDYMRRELPLMNHSEDALRISLEVRRLMEGELDEPKAEGGTEGKPSKGGKGKGEGKGDPGKGAGDSAPSEGDPVEGEGEDAETGDADGSSDKGEPAPKKEGGPGDEDEGDGEARSKPGAIGDDTDKGGDVKGDDEITAGEDERTKDTRADEKPLDWEAFSDALGKADFDEKLAEVLSEESVKAAKEADYIIYTTDQDIVEPLEPGGGAYTDEALKVMTEKVDHMVGVLQKDLERAVAARTKSTFTAGHRSGRLHAGALSRLTMFNDDRIFRRKHESSTREVAVSLLIDCSGSMRGPRIQLATYAAYGLSSVLERLNISNEVLGFTTRGNFTVEASKEARRTGVRYARLEPIYMPIIKDFNERLTTEEKRRFAALTNASWLTQNVDGECVQMAAARLAKRREPRKILIVLSDGQPACPGDGPAQHAHLKRVVKEVEASGIEVLGIGIQSGAPREFYSKSVILQSLEALPAEVMGQIKQILMKV